MITRIAFIISSILIFSSCKSELNEDAYKQSMKEWHQNRLERLKSEKGWFNLVGLHWLSEGENSIGSAKSNSIIFPNEAPAKIGSIFLLGDSVWFVSNEKTEVSHDGFRIDTISLVSDMEGTPTQLTVYPFSWFIIKRGERYGIRLRNYESALIEKIKHIPHYPIDLKWRVEAQFVKFDNPKTVLIPNVLGDVEEQKCYGNLIFEIDHQQYSLIPLGDGGSPFFIIFADETSALETYGAGRFLSTEMPDDDGNVIIDFNKAYNPPCAFTEYATCPLPPKENILKIKVTAGEKIGEDFGHH